MFLSTRPNESYILGPFDRDKWVEVGGPSIDEERELADGELTVLMTLMNPVAGDLGKDTPDVSRLISESSIEVV
jgi:hypothetical protein